MKYKHKQTFLLNCRVAPLQKLINYFICSQNRSISYYEVPVATTMSTFTYDIPPQNSTATANASTNVTAVRSPYLTAGTPAYNRYSTINRDRGLV